MASADFDVTGVRPSPDVIARRLGDSGILVHLPSNRIFELNETGVRIWELIVEGASLTTILERLQEEFSVDTADAARELDAFVRDLRQEHFLLA